MSVRVKFCCTKVSQNIIGFEVEMSPVTRGGEENNQFFKYTPQGELKIGPINESAAAQFAPGWEYYLTFEPAPAE